VVMEIGGGEPAATPVGVTHDGRRVYGVSGAT
jgi:hypothetical protein